MRTIQEVGTEILTGNPSKFYVMLGSEYGIKMKYISILCNHFNCDVYNCNKVSDALNIMTTKHIVPLSPAVYVIRYDDEFAAGLSNDTQHVLDRINVVGTIVCIYESSKHAAKFEKYLPNYTVSIDAISYKYRVKYLHQDFPHLSDNLIDIAATIACDYNQAQNMCRCMAKVPSATLCTVSKESLASTFGMLSSASDDSIRRGIAARNFKYLMSVLANYEGTVDNVIYIIMSTMIEFDKLMDNKYTESDIKQYLNMWSRADVYYMFMHAYNELERIRSSSVVDPAVSIVYLCALIKYPRIPDLEALK